MRLLCLHCGSRLGPEISGRQHQQLQFKDAPEAEQPGVGQVGAQPRAPVRRERSRSQTGRSRETCPRGNHKPCPEAAGTQGHFNGEGPSQAQGLDSASPDQAVSIPSLWGPRPGVACPRPRERGADSQCQGPSDPFSLPRPLPARGVSCPLGWAETSRLLPTQSRAPQEAGESLSHCPAGADSVPDAIDPPRAELCPSCSDSPPANVTLDPDTAYPWFVLLGDGKRVRWTWTRQPRPDTLERFDYVPCVLGSEGFTSGRHYWEVEVEVGGGRWAMGVARESVSRKGEISLSPKGGIWAVGQWGDQFQALTDPVTPLPLSPPSRIQVCLDCDRGQVTFIDAGTEAPIFTFPPGSLPGERIRPWLWVRDRSLQLRLSP
nr:tripartite motif-containing protein 10-like [Pelodiscus sinensis]|eukprot:XP_025039037.1 tripartite motif-containing protein 10-like [Pelodiscus sinensis]